MGTQYYYVVVTNTNNSVNGTKTATTVSNVATFEVSQYTSAEIRNTLNTIVYPNPTDGKFTLQFEVEGKYIVTIIDMNGKILQCTTENGQTVRMDISNLHEGVYLLIIENGKQRTVIRIVKNN